MEEKLRYYLKKLLAALRVRTIVAGMEISDVALRFVYSDEKQWHFAGVRLAPGVMETGKIKKYDEFVAAVRALKLQAFGEHSAKRRVSVIASLSSVNIYSQVFSLPIIEEENLKKAIQLNIQMVSPIDAAEAYSGWQTIGKDQKALRLEILSAFIDRSTVDEIGRALIEAGFLVVALEPRALALARVFKEAGSGFDPGKSYIVASLDNSGLDFLVIRRGQFYFEYFNPWRDIADEKGQIPTAAFEAAVIRSLHQVFNFYGQHWPEPVSEVILAATGLRDEVKRIVIENFSLPVRDMELRTQSIGSEWFVALGCGIRGLVARGKDKEMSLSGLEADDEFRREQAINFTRFWRLLMPVALGILFIAFVVSDLFLIQVQSSLESHALFNLKPEQARENQALQAQAEEFNRTVALIQGVQKATVLKSQVWEKIYGIMNAYKITPTRFSLPSPGAPSTLTGMAPNIDDLSAFKKALEGDGKFQNVTLPFPNIQQNEGFVSFSMTFVYTP
jgi:hypothetical protein